MKTIKQQIIETLNTSNTNEYILPHDIKYKIDDVEYNFEIPSQYSSRSQYSSQIYYDRIAYKIIKKYYVVGTNSSFNKPFPCVNGNKKIFKRNKI